MLEPIQHRTTADMSYLAWTVAHQNMRVALLLTGLATIFHSSRRGGESEASGRRRGCGSWRTVIDRTPGTRGRFLHSALGVLPRHIPLLRIAGTGLESSLSPKVSAVNPAPRDMQLLTAANTSVRAPRQQILITIVQKERGIAAITRIPCYAIVRGTFLSVYHATRRDG